MLPWQGLLSLALCMLLLCIIGVTATDTNDSDNWSEPMLREKAVWNYTLPSFAVRQSMQNCCGKRLLRVIKDLEAGKTINVAVVGGSYSLPDRISMDEVWFSIFVDKYLKKRYPTANVSGHNAAVGGSNAGFAYLCLDKMLPPKVDLVFVDYGPNMMQKTTHDIVNPNQYYEQLLRALLAYPGDPAVIAVEQLLPSTVPYYRYPEVTSSPLYKYYDVPYISVGSSLWRMQVLNTSGFADPDIRMKSTGNTWAYWHLNARGHKLVADMAVFLFQTAAAMDKADLLPEQKDPLWATGVRAGPEHIHMLPTHPVKRPLLCIMPDELPGYVTNHTGWEYGADDSHKRKFGYISFHNGSSDPKLPTPSGLPELRLEWDGKLVGKGAAAAAGGGSSSSNSSSSSSYALILVYLASYSGMGAAEMSCAGACRCTAQNISATIPEFSLTKVRPAAVTLSPGKATGSSVCQMRVINNSPGGDHAKFKVTGFILAEMHPGREAEIGRVTFMNHGGGGTVKATVVGRL
ncbi:hypothetical protein Agub_g14904 [Astrephomene gubernaculifera]|uniref:Uncharacterized protein n=1 Tax=Astrephomene gubernaculifera TaxID=47775 RepID=A0AAD3E2F6_9CHLO|nr:hypothetical protein Agub_g14904 [Astrephomene gubernaculifera]